MRWSVFALLLIVNFWNAQSAKVLFIGPMAAHSHFTLVFRLAKEMVDRGHQVTVINPYPQKTPIKNYRDVSVEEIVVFVDEIRKRLLSENDKGVFDRFNGLFNMSSTLTEMTFKNKNVQELLNSNETFDVVVLEQFVDEALIGIGNHFKAPVILLSPMPSGGMNNYLFANPSPSSYVPNPMGSFTKHMDFWQRVQNFLANLAMELFTQLFYLPKQREIFDKYIKTDVDFDTLLYNVSLMLTNSHVSVNDAVPHVPGIIEIGGYHISPPKPLPKELQQFLDDAKDGVVLFSMGSNLRSKDLKPEVRASILKAFSKIKQQVLWKFETDLPDAPKNVRIMKWVPQQDVLGHPNVKAFISHGGLLSTIETVYNGVPVIGIPVFGDQENNIASAVKKGYAVNVPLGEITEEKLSWALNEVLNNPKYRENVRARSKLMHDQPLKPIDTAVYWIEHVIRHKGAPHLRSAGLDLKWYQREMVDVIGFLGLVVLAVCAAILVTVKKIVGWLCKSKSKKNQKIKKH